MSGICGVVVGSQSVVTSVNNSTVFRKFYSSHYACTDQRKTFCFKSYSIIKCKIKLSYVSRIKQTILTISLFNMISDKSEITIFRCSLKKLHRNVSRNSQENTCVGASFLMKLQNGSVSLLKFSRNSFFTEHRREITSVRQQNQ